MELLEQERDRHPSSQTPTAKSDDSYKEIEEILLNKKTGRKKLFGLF